MWEPDKEYRNYQWWLARTTGGNWDLVLYNEDADSSGSSGSTAGKTEPATEENNQFEVENQNVNADYTGNPEEINDEFCWL